MMKLKIIDIDFTDKNAWLFKLCDETGNDFFIMMDAFYKKYNLKTPITKKELDYLDKGQWLRVSFKEIEGMNLVIAIQ